MTAARRLAAILAADVTRGPLPTSADAQNLKRAR